MRPMEVAEVPDHFRCPISLELMKDPVVLSTGITYDRDSIEAWLRLQSRPSRNNMKCPVTKQILQQNEVLIPNQLLRSCIQHWCVQHGNPAGGSIERMPDSAQTIASILLEGHPEGKRKAVLFLQQMAADPLLRENLRAIEGLAEGLLQFLRDNEAGLFPTPAIAATASTIYYIAGDENVRVKLAEGGAVSLLLKILPVAGRDLSGKCLGALDRLCQCAQGRSAAYANNLTVPLIVQKILPLPDLADEFAVSILWTLCRYSDSPSVALAALEENSFQKLLVLVQLGCEQETKKRASQLLGLFNHYRQDEYDWRWVSGHDGFRVTDVVF